MNRPTMQHNITLSERHVLSVSGVTDIISFDEKGAVLEISQSELNVTGTELTVTKLSLETGEVALTGNIEAIFYTVSKPKKSFFGRLFS